MNEVISVTPAVEVRETFKPNEYLRNALADFFNPELDDRTRESLRASLLLKSWRRRVMSRERYYGEERQKDHSVRDASVALRHIQGQPVGFDGSVGLMTSDRGIAGARILLRPTITPALQTAAHILETIPTEANPEDEQLTQFLYVEVAKRSLASREQVLYARDMLHHKLVHPATAKLHTAMIHELSTKETLARITPTQA